MDHDTTNMSEGAPELGQYAADAPCENNGDTYENNPVRDGSMAFFLYNKKEPSALDLAYADKIYKKAKSGSPAKTHIAVYILEDQNVFQLFIDSYLEHLALETKGFFTAKKKRASVIQYRCERNRKPRGKSMGSPDKSRANSCPAYVSFSSESSGLRCVCIVRSMLHHLPYHNPCDDSHNRVSTLSPSIIDLISSELGSGRSAAQVLVACHKWAKTQGHSATNRRYYPTPEDIWYIKSKIKQSGHMNVSDSLSVRSLVGTQLKSAILLYQELDRSKNQPFLLVYQNEYQREVLKTHGDMVFMDATFSGITAYKFAFYALSVKYETGRGTPVAYIITSDESSEALTCCLDAIKSGNDKFYPRFFMIDRDMKEVQGIRNVFPLSTVLLCWFHVLQCIHRWLTKRESGCSGPSQHQLRKQIMMFFCHLKNCTTEEDFHDLAANMSNEGIPMPVQSYIQSNWLGLGTMWANFGRRAYHEECETNNLAERFFLSLKYQFLCGVANRRVDDLLLLLHGDIAQYFECLSELQKAGRLKSKREKGTTGLEKANRLIHKGWEKNVVDMGHGVYSIPSEKDSTHKYEADVVELTCSCPAAAAEGMCKHLNLAIILAERDKPMDERRQQAATEICDANLYVSDMDSGFMQVFRPHSEYSSVVDMKSKHCTCYAACRHVKCVCLKVLDSVSENTEQQSISSTSELPLGCSVAESVDIQGQELNTLDTVQDAKLKTTEAVDTKDLIKRLYQWSTSDDFIDSQHLQHHVEQAYTSAFSSFTPVTRLKKVHVLEPHRRAMKRQEHSYSAASHVKKPKIKRRSIMPDIDFIAQKGSLSVRRKSRTRNMKQIYNSKKNEH